MKPRLLPPLLFGLGLLSACAVTTPNQTQNQTARGDFERLEFVGRVAPSATRVRYAWSGAGFVARFRGTGFAVRLRDDKNEHQVVLDGKPTARVVTRSGEERYVLAENLAPGEHRVELYRRTEAMFGPTHLLGVEVLSGELLAPAKSARRSIEVVGDSISCGYGNEGTAADCPFSPETENHYLSYGARLARAFDADISTVAWSGRGVVKNYAGGEGEKMVALYDRILPSEPKARATSAREFDAVIVNLGTNDFSTEPDPGEQEFVRGYVELLAKIRKNSPKAQILCTVGPMLAPEDQERADQAIAAAVKVRRAAGDDRVVAYSMKTANQNPGCDYHPGLETHQQMAEELSVPLKQLTGW